MCPLAVELGLVVLGELGIQGGHLFLHILAGLANHLGLRDGPLDQFRIILSDHVVIFAVQQQADQLLLLPLDLVPQGRLLGSRPRPQFVQLGLQLLVGLAQRLRAGPRDLPIPLGLLYLSHDLLIFLLQDLEPLLLQPVRLLF
jgi:hypothetical protein